jgi:hypothetical protein
MGEILAWAAMRARAFERKRAAKVAERDGLDGMFIADAIRKGKAVAK